MLIFFLRIFFLPVLLLSVCFSQTKDTASIVNRPISHQKHSPFKATVMSAVIPGLGQAYNKKYWKIPIIYAGFAGMGYVIRYNYTKYNKYKSCYLNSLDTDTTNDTCDPRYTPDNLRTLSDAYRRDLDLSIIVAAGIYILNIIDATVDGHLYSFDIGDNLSMSAQPLLFTMQHRQVFGGISIKIQL